MTFIKFCEQNNINYFENLPYIIKALNYQKHSVGIIHMYILVLTEDIWNKLLLLAFKFKKLVAYT